MATRAAASSSSRQQQGQNSEDVRFMIHYKKYLSMSFIYKLELGVYELYKMVAAKMGVDDIASFRITRKDHEGDYILMLYSDDFSMCRSSYTTADGFKLYEFTVLDGPFENPNLQV